MNPISNREPSSLKQLVRRPSNPRCCKPYKAPCRDQGCEQYFALSPRKSRCRNPHCCWTNDQPVPELHCLASPIRDSRRLDSNNYHNVDRGSWLLHARRSVFELQTFCEEEACGHSNCPRYLYRTRPSGIRRRCRWRHECAGLAGAKIHKASGHWNPVPFGIHALQVREVVLPLRRVCSAPVRGLSRGCCAYLRQRTLLTF